MKNLNFKEFAALYCEKQECTPELLRDKLNAQRMEYHPDGFMMLEAGLMDSKYFGSRVILPYGPNNTYKMIPDHPVSPRGLASDTSTVIAILPIERWEEV